jgi:hypothetical protein
MAHQVSIDDSTISSGDQEEERESPPSTPESEDSGKKSLLGKLKDKTMTKVSQLKKKVSQKKSVQSSGSSELKKDDSSDSSASSDEDEDTTTATKSAPKTVIGSAPESIAGATTPSQTEDAPSDLTLQADDTAPISQYRNEGPAGIMQAVPTQYRDYASERFQPAQLDYNSHTIQGVFFPLSFLKTLWKSQINSVGFLLPNSLWWNEQKRISESHTRMIKVCVSKVLIFT